MIRNHFPIIPRLNYPLRNTKEIVRFIKGKTDGKSQIDYYNHKFNIDNLRIPSNLTSTIKPREIHALNYRDGFEKAIEAVQELSGSKDRPTMFVINTNEARDDCTKCYNPNLPTVIMQSKKFIENIYAKMERENTLIQDLYAPTGLDQSHQIDDWLKDPTGKDALVRLETMDGFTHDVVVVFQEDNLEKFEHNVCMRCTAILIVVYIPPTPHLKFCFCGICANCEKLTNQRCRKCTKLIYFCSDDCFAKQWSSHEEECNDNKKVAFDVERFMEEVSNDLPFRIQFVFDGSND